MGLYLFFFFIFIDNLVNKNIFYILDTNISLKNGKTFITSHQSPWQPWNSLIIGIKVKRIQQVISADYFPENKHGNNWNTRYYEFEIPEFNIDDIEYVKIVIMRIY